MSEFSNLRGDFCQWDFSAFAKLATVFKRFPIQARQATAEVLNSLAFNWRPLALSTLASKVIIRSASFDLSRMRVQKTSAQPISQQYVIVGSIITKGKGGKLSHDGWASLQTGGEPTRNRTMALLSRGGDERAIVKSKYRLKPGSDIRSSDDAPVLHGSRAQALIRNMAKNAPNTPFIIRKGLGVAPGLYKIRKGRGYPLPDGRSAAKIQILQHFGKRPRGQRFDWIGQSVKRLLAHSNMQKLWNDALMRVMGRGL